jgi:rare lipoprotein A
LPEGTVTARSGRPSPFSVNVAIDPSKEAPLRGTIAAEPQPADSSKPADPGRQPTVPAQAETKSLAEPAAPNQKVFTGRASYFGDDLNGRPTASGERFSNDSMTAAHAGLPFGTRLRVRNLGNGRSIVVRVNDRAALRGGFVLRVTRAAARSLGFERAGSARVRIEVIQ